MPTFHPPTACFFSCACAVNCAHRPTFLTSDFAISRCVRAVPRWCIIVRLLSRSFHPISFAMVLCPLLSCFRCLPQALALCFYLSYLPCLPCLFCPRLLRLAACEEELVFLSASPSPTLAFFLFFFNCSFLSWKSIFLYCPFGVPCNEIAGTTFLSCFLFLPAFLPFFSHSCPFGVSMQLIISICRY